MLIIFLNVGHFSQNDKNSLKHTTFIRKYYDRHQKGYKKCHYSLLAYSFINYKCFNCDSLGWSKLIFIGSYIEELILLLKTQPIPVHITECHSKSNSIYSHELLKIRCAYKENVLCFSCCMFAAIFAEQFNVIYNGSCFCKENAIFKNFPKFNYYTEGKGLGGRITSTK